MPPWTWTDAAFGLGPLLLGVGATRLLVPSRTPCVRTAPSELQPPGWAFGVAWAVLYALVGAAGALAWRRCGRRWLPHIVAFVALVCALVAWFVAFATTCAPSAAFAAMLMVDAIALVTVVMFARAGGAVATALLLPLVVWLAFASYLAWAAAR
jgi:benzodiazapine receptor